MNLLVQLKTNSHHPKDLFQKRDNTVFIGHGIAADVAAKEE